MTTNKYVEVTGVSFIESHRIQYYKSNGMELKHGDKVIVSYNQAKDYGTIVKPPFLTERDKFKGKIPKIIRKLNKLDRQKIKKLKHKEQNAFETCFKKLNERELEMKLISVHYSFDQSKIVFYFTADGRIDFRELVKDLVHIYKTRIELRQIGPRDETLMLGGIGLCGYKLCCSKWLDDFDKISIKMAKRQQLSLNINKITGLCGRLLCCISYEYELYDEELKKYPDLNYGFKYNDMKYKVVQVNIIKKTVTIKSQEDVYTEISLSDFNERTKSKKQYKQKERNNDKK